MNFIVLRAKIIFENIDFFLSRSNRHMETGLLDFIFHIAITHRLQVVERLGKVFLEFSFPRFAMNVKAVVGDVERRTVAMG